MTTFPIVWDEQQPTDQLVFAELTEEEKKLAETSEEQEMCDGIDNVHCSDESSDESDDTIEEKSTDDIEKSSTEPKTTME